MFFRPLMVTGFLLISVLVGMSPVMAGDVFNGDVLYRKHCESCHGKSGEGLMPGMADFSRGEGLFSADSQLLDILRGGKGVMPGYGQTLSDQQLRDIVAFIRTLM